MRTQRGLRGSGGFGRGTMLYMCSFIPAGLAVPFSAHVDAAFWRLVSLALGAELELVRRVGTA